MPVILSLGRQRPEDLEFKASLGILRDPVSKKKRKEKRKGGTIQL
jgi:hypothetical protein